MAELPSSMQDFNEFVETFTRFKTDNLALMKELAAAVDAAGNTAAIHEHLDHYVEELKSTVSAELANRCVDNDAEQEEAFDQVEAWVTENVGNGSIEDRMTAVLWLEGLDVGKALLKFGINSKPIAQRSHP